MKLTLPHRIAGLHPFGNGGFQQVKQNFALFVIDMDPDNKRKCVTAATALPGQYFNTMALMNSQATQVSILLGECRIFWGGHE